MKELKENQRLVVIYHAFDKCDDCVKSPIKWIVNREDYSKTMTARFMYEILSKTGGLENMNPKTKGLYFIPTSVIIGIEVYDYVPDDYEYDDLEEKNIGFLIN